jgi:hypothetical protein
MSNVERALQTFNLDKDTICPVIGQANCQQIIPNLFPEYKINSLEHYADVLYSSKRLISFHSGQHSLAAAIKHQTNCDLEINTLILEQYMSHNGPGYHFKNVNYFNINKYTQ